MSTKFLPNWLRLTTGLFLVLAALAPASAAYAATAAIAIETRVNDINADSAPGYLTSVGSTLEFTYIVFNVGDVTLAAVYVTDDQGLSITCPKTTLAVGEGMTCTATTTALAGQHVHMGSASGAPMGGAPVTSSDPAYYEASAPPCSDSITVTNANNSGAGSLRQAIADVCNGGTINFDNDYTITLTSDQLTVDKDMTIDGAGHSITVSGNDAVRVFQVNTGVTFNLQNLTVANGFADSWEGGGMFVFGYPDGATVNISHVTFRNNHDWWVSGIGGGGIASIYGNLTLTDVTFRDNWAFMGAGMSNLEGTSTLTNVTFTGNGGEAQGFSAWTAAGGGMAILEGSATLTNVTFNGNMAEQGGGMVNAYGNATLTDVTFNGNSADSGGGIFNTYDGIATLTDVTFSGNSASASGGGMVNNSSATLMNVTFDGNTAVGSGGGLYADNAYSTLTDVTFSNNQAGNGGGMFVEGGKATLANTTFDGNTASFGGGMFAAHDIHSSLTNVTFYGNSAEADGGGLYTEYSMYFTVANSTFIANSAGWRGGGIYNGDTDTGQFVKNTILWGNTAAQGGAQMSISVYEGPLPVSYSIVQDGCPTNASCSDLLTADPLVGAPGNYGGPTQTIPLLFGSPAVDAGLDSACPVTDQRGVARPQGAHCDIGAYESEAIPDTTPPVVEVTGVTEGATYLLGAVPAAGCSTTDEGSGVAQYASLTLTGDNALGVGNFTAACDGALDNAGNAGNTAVVHYSVSFLFMGFSAPVDNSGVLNLAKAGQAIPLKFRITDADGNPITNLTSVTVTAVSLSCSSGTTTDLIEEYAAGTSGLQNLGDGYYQWNWKTPTTYANLCKTLRLDLGEGIFHTALFQFKK